MGKDHRIPTTAEHLLRNKLDRIEQQVVKLKSRLRTPTMPRHDPEFPLDSVDGAHGLRDGDPWYFWDGAWHRFQNPGELILVGTYPTDAGTVALSPPFQHAWGRVGGDYPPLAFARNGEGYVRIQGTCDGGADGSVVFTFPLGYRPEKSVRFVGALTNGSDFLTWQVDPTGDAIIVARGYVAPDGSIALTKLSLAGGDDGDVLQIVAGVATWADLITTTSFYVAGVHVADETGVNFSGDGRALHVTVTDDAPNTRVDVDVAIEGGTPGQVLTSDGTDGDWADLPAPTPSLIIEHNEAGPHTRGKLDFNDTALVVFTVTDDAGDDEVDVSATVPGGADGQILKTVGATPTWSDVKRRFVATFHGLLPTATGPSEVIPIPYDDGVAVTFDLTRITLRCEQSGSTATDVTVEKSNAGGAFVPVAVGSAAIAAGANDDSETAGLGSVTSGNLIRVNFTSLGTGAQNYTVQVEGDEP